MAQETIADRLQTYFINKRIKVAQVSRDAGIQYDSLQQILSGKVKAMGVDKFAAIWKVFPDLDAWYILTGEPSKDQRQATDLSTVEALREFQAQMNAFVEGKIKEINNY